MCKRLNLNLTRKILIFLCIFCFLPIFLSSLFAERLVSEKDGFSIDFVDGLYVSEKTESSWYLESDFLPIEFAVNVYKSGRFSNTKDVISYSAKQVKASSVDTDLVTYRNYDCSISSMEFSVGDVPCVGWLLAIKLKNSKILSVLGFTAKENDAIFESMILSSLDAVSVDRASFFNPGPVTCYAYPKEGVFRKNIDFEGSKYAVTFDKIDSEAARYVVSREYNILSYLSSTDFWFSSWQRFYQMIYRDSYGRVKDGAFDFCSKLYEKYADSDNVEELFASCVLRYVQNLPYGRSKDENDFTNLVSTFLSEPSDCDSRALLCAIFLNMMDIKSTLFVSVEYSHALVGANLNSQGAKLLCKNDWYLLGETTSHVDFGKIAQDMSDSSKWLNINLDFAK